MANMEAETTERNKQNDRFASLTDSDLDMLLIEKDAASTRRTTNGAVKVFRLYLKEKGLPENFEQASSSDLDSYLSQFYAEARQQNGEKYQRTSLNSIRYGIKRHLNDKDIINGSEFRKSKDMFIAVTKDLKRDGKGGINHYPPMEDADLMKMYSYFDIQDRIKLQQKVFVDIMLYFGRRGRENLSTLNITDFAATTDSNGDMYIFMKGDELTKNHQYDPNSADGRMYAKKDDDLCPVKSFIKYKKQLNPKCSRLFQRPGKGDTKWYENAPIGHNKIANMMPTISDSAGLSTRYTNHSLRATSVHILDSKQFAGRHIMSVTGHKSETSLKTYTGYTDQSIKRRMSDTISESLRTCIQPKKSKPDNENMGSNITTMIPAAETVDFDTNKVTFEPLSNAQMNEVMTELQDDAGFEDIMKTINTRDMTPSPPKAIPQPPMQYHTQPTAPQMPVQYHSQPVINQLNQNSLMNFPVPMFSGCSNVTINYNFHSNK